MSGHFLCPICTEDFDSKETFEHHKTTDEHRIKWLHRTYHTNRKSFVQDKNGISIDVRNEGPVEYGRDVDTIFINLDEDLAFSITICYNGTEDILLLGADILNTNFLLSSDTRITVDDEFNICKRTRALKLRKESKYPIRCTIEPGSLMRTLHIPLIFEFEGSSLFYYGKTLEIAGNTFNLIDFGNAVPGVRLKKFEGDKLEKIVSLKHYNVPPDFTRIAHDNNANALRRLMKIQPQLTHENYANYFTTLLWLEELQLHLDIQYYSKKEARLTMAPPGAYNYLSKARCAELMVEGLSENRPSVLLGDVIMAAPCIDEKPLGIHRWWYEGIVHSLTSNSVYLGFDQLIFMNRLQDEGLLCDIEFLINRLSLRCCHRALHTCSRELSHLLFPVAPTHRAPLLPDISLYNAKLGNNPEQLQAVRHIVAGSSHPAPYLVFGPPGTGKTVTIVEAIKQVLHMHPSSHVLACAPSNSAADILTEYLLDNLTSLHVCRLYAASRERFSQMISARVKEASNFGHDGKVYFSPKEELMKKRVIVCTFITAARIVAAQFPSNFFTHVFLDEVGHSMEPEALVGVGGVLNRYGHLILAGDHHQLGPVVRSSQAKGGEKNNMFPHTGLDMSYLERLMNMDIYKEREGRFNPRLVTKLLNNYRSHKDILLVPNKLFYGSQLKVKGNPSVTDIFTNWPELPRQGFPLIFHSTSGQDKMTPRSPSYFNQEEINVVMKYVQELVTNGHELGLSEDDIGIITPYRLQVQKIRDALRRNHPDQVKSIKVGSVEDFQGEERKVIIISTVRATKTHIGKDEIFALGFLRNPKRFNVAVTRAKSLLIVVGCANILQLDKNWRMLIDHIRNGGGFKGKLPPKRKEDLDSLMAKLGEIDTRPTVGKPSTVQVVEAPQFVED